MLANYINTGEDPDKRAAGINFLLLLCMRYLFNVGKLEHREKRYETNISHNSTTPQESIINLLMCIFSDYTYICRNIHDSRKLGNYCLVTRFFTQQHIMKPLSFVLSVPLNRIFYYCIIAHSPLFNLRNLSVLNILLFKIVRLLWSSLMAKLHILNFSGSEINVGYYCWIFPGRDFEPFK